MENKHNRLSVSEEEFLDCYNINDYDRPSVTADIAAFKLRTVTGDTYRHNNKSKLSVLLIKRGVHPYMGCWALPGGFLRKNETIEECAFREIKEESGITPVSIMPVGVFSNIDRDPRGRIISSAYLSIISEGETKVVGGTDASDARWFDVDFEESNEESFIQLISGDEILKINLRKVKTLFKKTDYEVVGKSDLAFDHGKILGTAISILRNYSKDYDLIFDFLPELFTLTALQNVLETIMDISITPANFRRKISEFVEETDKYVTGAGHRPAKLFKRKQI